MQEAMKQQFTFLYFTYSQLEKKQDRHQTFKTKLLYQNMF